MESNRPSTQKTPVAGPATGSDQRQAQEGGEDSSSKPLLRARLPASLFDYFLKPHHWDTF